MYLRSFAAAFKCSPALVDAQIITPCSLNIISSFSIHIPKKSPPQAEPAIITITPNRRHFFYVLFYISPYAVSSEHLDLDVEGQGESSTNKVLARGYINKFL
jgi:hypothetical protein